MEKTRMYRLCTIALLVALGSFNVGCTTAINRSLTQVEAEESFNKGDFTRSFRLTEAMAYQGDKKAQYALGYMYYYGIGTPKIPALGIAWMQQAAIKGYAPAEVALSMLNHPGLETRPGAICSAKPIQVQPEPVNTQRVTVKESYIPAVAQPERMALRDSYIPPLSEKDRVTTEPTSVRGSVTIASTFL